MNSTGIRNLDNAIQTTNVWLRDLDLILGWNDRVKTYAALRTVFHALRDELMVFQDVVSSDASTMESLMKMLFVL